MSLLVSEARTLHHCHTALVAPIWSRWTGGCQTGVKAVWDLADNRLN